MAIFIPLDKSAREMGIVIFPVSLVMRVHLDEYLHGWS